MNSYKKLFNNVLVFGVGNLGSKIISFLLVPLYTYYLTQAEYGTSDLVFTTVNMLMPLVSAVMYEAIIRFIMDKNRANQADEIMTNAFAISGVGFLILLLFYPILNYFNFLDGSLPYLYVLLFVQIIKQMFSQYARAIGRSKIFAIQGILTTFSTGVLNILFLVQFGWGLTGYFLAFILGYLLTIIYLLIVISPLKEIKLSTLNLDFMKELLFYSIPLIPNNLMWWLINSSSRYFIRGFVGIDANGLFAVSSRIPSFISIVSQVFSQAWQLSAFEEYEKEDDSSFYSEIFALYAGILLVLTTLIIVILKPAFNLLFATEFYLSWQPVPFLLLGSAFSALSGFVGVAYTASKQTKGVFRTSVYGGIASLILNIIFIPTLGIVGAGISSMVSFFIMFILRYYDTREMVQLDINWKKFLSTTGLILLQTLILFVNIGLNVELVVNSIIAVVILFINRDVFKMIPFIWNTVVEGIKKR